MSYFLLNLIDFNPKKVVFFCSHFTYEQNHILRVWNGSWNTGNSHSMEACASNSTLSVFVGKGKETILVENLYNLSLTFRAGQTIHWIRFSRIDRGTPFFISSTLYSILAPCLIGIFLSSSSSPSHRSTDRYDLRIERSSDRGSIAIINHFVRCDVRRPRHRFWTREPATDDSENQLPFSTTDDHLLDQPRMESSNRSLNSVSSPLNCCVFVS